jgi:hypothetical protein
VTQFNLPRPRCAVVPRIKPAHQARGLADAKLAQFTEHSLPAATPVHIALLRSDMGLAMYELAVTGDAAAKLWLKRIDIAVPYAMHAPGRCLLCDTPISPSESLGVFTMSRDPTTPDGDAELFWKFWVLCERCAWGGDVEARLLRACRGVWPRTRFKMCHAERAP